MFSDILGKIGLQTRLVSGFGIILLMLVALTILGSRDVSLIDDGLATINDLNAVKQRYAINFRGSVHDRSIAIRDVILVSDDRTRQEAIEEIATLKRAYTESDTRMQALARKPGGFDADERRIYQSINEIQAQTLPIVERILSLQASGQSDQAKTILEQQARPAFVTWLARINQFIDLEEAKNSGITKATREVAAGFRVRMWIITGIALLIGAGIALWNIIGIRPLSALSERVLALADDKLEAPIPDVSTADEVGAIARSVCILREKAIAARTLRQETEERERAAQQAEQARQAQEQQAETARRAEQDRLESEARDARRSMLLELASGFEAKVLGLAKELGASARTLEDSAQVMHQSASNNIVNADNMRAAMGETSDNVNDLSTRANSLSASISEVSRQTAETSHSAKQAVTVTDTAVRDIEQLNSASQQIGDVVNLIADIAEQTNLLALNATIEAARAGDAGKGFAVVASEVKSLANQTASATQQISTQITDMQSATNTAVQSVEAIRGSIVEIDQSATTMEKAINTQEQDTASIAQNVGTVSQLVSSTENTASDVASRATRASENAGKVLSAAKEASEKADVLTSSVQDFLQSVRED